MIRYFFWPSVAAAFIALQSQVPLNNLGSVAEKMVQTGSRSAFDQSVEGALTAKIQTIYNATNVEPYDVNHNAAGDDQGPINFYPYQLPCP